MQCFLHSIGFSCALVLGSITLNFVKCLICCPKRIWTFWAVSAQFLSGWKLDNPVVPFLQSGNGFRATSQRRRSRFDTAIRLCCHFWPFLSRWFDVWARNHTMLPLPWSMPVIRHLFQLINSGNHHWRMTT